MIILGVAMVLLTRQGETASEESIRKVNQYGNRLGTFFQQETEGRGSLFTVLRLRADAAKAALVAPTAAQPEPAAIDAPGGEMPSSEEPAAAPAQAPDLPREFRERIERFLDFPFRLI